MRYAVKEKLTIWLECIVRWQAMPPPPQELEIRGG